MQFPTCGARKCDEQLIEAAAPAAADSGGGTDVSWKDLRVGLTDTFTSVSAGTVSARLEPLRVVAASNVAQGCVTWHPLAGIKFNHTRPDRSAQHDLMSGKFNSRIVNTPRFNTTAGLTKVQASVSKICVH